MTRIHVIMMHGDVRMNSPGLREGLPDPLALEKIEIKRGRKNKYFGYALFGYLGDGGSQGIDGNRV